MLGIKQTVSPTNEHEVFAAQGDYVELGTYEDYSYMHKKAEVITICVTIKNIANIYNMLPGPNVEAVFSIDYDYDAMTDQARLHAIKIYKKSNDLHLPLFELTRKTTRDGYWLHASDDAVKAVVRTFPMSKSITGKREAISLSHIERFKFVTTNRKKEDDWYTHYAFNQLMDTFSKTFEGDIFYLGPLRSSPARSYIRTSHRSEVGPKGEHTPSVFATLEKRQKKVTTGKEKSELKISYDTLMEWTNILFPGKFVSTNTYGELVKLKVNSRVNNLIRADSINDVGFGFSQIFPILVQMAVMPGGSTLIIEQPELHMHPMAQANLAKIIVSAANMGKRFIIETHSEHFVRGLQLSVSEFKKDHSSGIGHEKINMFYVPEGEAIFSIGLNEWGELLREWPSGFFDEAYKLSYRLMMNKMESVQNESTAEVV